MTIPVSLLDARKPCPKCNKEMKYLFSWIEHDGFGHTGPPIAWICDCGHKEDMEWKNQGGRK